MCDRNWSVVFLYCIYTLLSQVYFVCQIVKTPTIISNHPVLYQINCINLYIFVWVIVKKNGMGGACSGCGCGERRVQGFREKNLRKRDHLGDPGVDGRILLKCIFREWDVGVWTALGWIRVETGGWYL
jgi:hypothetical protein